MIRNLSITVLVDNRAASDELCSEHGLSLWIDADGYKILFDTGQSDALVHNAPKLGVDLGTADALVFSHGHYDHTGGTAAVFKALPPVAIYCHSGIFVPRYSDHGEDRPVFIGMKRETIRVLQANIDAITWITQPMYLQNNVGCTGSIPRVNRVEDTGGRFFLDTKQKRPDPITDDCALWFETVNGTVIVTGCCHSGLMNTIDYVNKLTDKTKLRSIFGGFHLCNASDERLRKTADYLQRTGMNEVVTCHCTGEYAESYLEKSVAVLKSETGLVYKVAENEIVLKNKGLPA